MMPRRQPRRPSIGLASAIESICASSLRLAASSLDGRTRALGLHDLDLELARVVEELVQRRVEQADRDRQAVHRLENAEVVAHLHLEELRQLRVALVLVLGEDVVLDDHLPLAEEHVLGAAQADALRAELAAERRVVRRVGVGAHAHRAELVGPRQDRVEVAGDLRLDQRDGAEHDDAGRTVDRDDVALVQLDVVP